MCASDMMMQKEVIKEKLNIGYLIPSWQDSKVAFFRMELVQQYSKDEFNVFCYVYDGKVKDFEWLQDGISRWRDIGGLRPEVIVRMIREDAVDVLVDLSGYKAAQAMLVLERKAASIQMVFVGYFNTTGLRTVDYLLTDKYCDVKEMKEGYFTEKIYCLPHTHFCYNGWRDFQKRKEIPFRKNKYITFGCYWNLVRLDDEFLAGWAQILTGVPNAKLILVSRIFGSGYGRQEMRYRLQRLGFDTERVAFRKVDREDSRDDGYQDVDIMLDTYPYQGGVRICDALYAGIPVVVMAGKKHYYRFGYSILKNIGLEECIGFGLKDYIQKAVTLAGNPYKLVNLRKNLQERLNRSPLMDVRRYVGNVERAYREIWTKRMEAKQRIKARTEAMDILHTVEDGFIFVRNNLMDQQDSPMVSQILMDIQQAFAYMKKILLAREFEEMGVKLVASMEYLLTCYQKQQYREICEGIEQELLPGIKEWYENLKRGKEIH